ncbi:FAD-binding oxidoreductase [Hellea sp.]|nr:FAD-binding oxidoreductase [Hellea sp.]
MTLWRWTKTFASLVSLKVRRTLSTSGRTKNEYDFVIIGAGFYGCCLALFLRSLSKRVLVIERDAQSLQRSSRVNQARVHSGFHYPRSALTAVKSGVLFKRFVKDWPDAVKDDFDMFYAIAARNSKVSSRRFARIFDDIGADFREADVSEKTLFDPNLIKGVFNCREFAFDFKVLRQRLVWLLDRANIEVRFGTEVTEIDLSADSCRLGLSSGDEVTANYLFNVTYSHVNQMHNKAGLKPVPIRHEIAELAIVWPPEALSGKAVTVMDGPFFSCMPYPSDGLYSLTHVRFTPHFTWFESETKKSPYQVLEDYNQPTRFEMMRRDSARYMPCLHDSVYSHSHFEVKTVLLKNERDDGRPILFVRDPDHGRMYSVLGGKIDNIYDLFDVVRADRPDWHDATDSHLFDAI